MIDLIFFLFRLYCYSVIQLTFDLLDDDVEDRPDGTGTYNSTWWNRNIQLDLIEQEHTAS